MPIRNEFRKEVFTSTWEEEGDRDWLNPIAMSHLQRAVESVRRKVILNGIEYKITYNISRVSPVTGEKIESVRLNRTDGQYAPCGFVKLSRIRDFEFESG